MFNQKNTRIKNIIITLLLLGLQSIYGEDFSRGISLENGKCVPFKSQNIADKPKLAIVLSGGGARGISHVGVLKVLDSLGVEPDLIVGTSIGGVIGGLYAAGYKPDEIEDIIRGIDWADIFSDDPQRTSLFLGQKNEQDRYLLSLRLTNFRPYIPNAVTPGQKVLNILSDLFLLADYQVKNSFDDLKIPFRSISTDIVSGEMVVLEDGNIAEALNGSLAVPLLFSPVSRDGMLLVDGGIKSNLPASVAKELGMDIVIASDVSATLRTIDQINAPWEIADQVTTIMTDKNNLKEYKNVDVLILPQIPAVTNTDFTKIDSLIGAGKQAALKEIHQIHENILKSQTPKGRQLQIKSVDFQGVSGTDHSFSGFSMSQDSSQSIFAGTIADSMEKWLESGVFQKITAHHDSLRGSLNFEFEQFGIIDSIRLSGNSIFSSTELVDSLFIGMDSVLNYKKLQKGIQKVRKLYRQNGYSLMEISNISFDKNRHILGIDIEEGIVEEIDVKGNEKTKNFIVLREFTLQKNDPFNWLNIKKGIDNVYASALYNRVSVDVMRHGQNADLIIRVDEKPSVRIQLGGKTDLERSAQGYLELADENFLGEGIKTKIQTRFGLRDGLIGLSLRNDRIFTTFLTFTAQTYFTWESNLNNIESENEGRYREERLGLRLQIGQQLRRIGQLVGEVRVERVKDFRLDGFDLDGGVKQKQDLELRTFALRSITDKRDRSDFPTKGTYNHWAWENGNSFLLNSQESYTKVLLNLESFYELYEDHIGHLRFLAGLGDESLPFSEYFRIGGLHSFYGLLDNELNGKQVVLMNFEYRYKLPFQIFTDTYVSARYDFGSISSSPNLVVDADDFFSGFGGYLGFDTFLGPLYCAWGKTSLGRSRIYLSLGFNY